MQDTIRRCLDWFDAHTRDYMGRASKDVLPMIQTKISHTMRVLSHTRAILREADVREDLVPVAEMVAILHDVGRFPQLADSASFDDRAGYNHAEEGARILAGASVLQPLNQTARSLVLTAVRHHNRGALPETLTDDERLILEILRDADKLDALRTTVKYMSPDTPYGKALKTGLTWHPVKVSDEVVDCASGGRLVPYTSIKWSNDFVLFLACWIYDLHFPYAYRHLHESGTYEALLDFLPDEPPFHRVKERLNADLARFRAEG